MYIVIIIVVVSAFINASAQFEGLKTARRENGSLEVKISELTESNMRLEQQIAYATSSAYLDQQARQMFGIGGSDDYWLKLPPEDKKLDLYPKVTKGKDLPIIQQWILLFTR